MSNALAVGDGGGPPNIRRMASAAHFSFSAHDGQEP